jgi:hypothetical protein
MNLDEAALRRPTWRDGHRITLSDGQEWTIPKPRLRLRPRFEGGRVVGTRDVEYAPEDDGLVDTLFGAGDAEPDAWIQARWELLARLLRANYDLSDLELAELVAIDPDDADGQERWTEITRALRGLGPKPSPAT